MTDAETWADWLTPDKRAQLWEWADGYASEEGNPQRQVAAGYQALSDLLDTATARLGRIEALAARWEALEFRCNDHLNCGHIACTFARELRGTIGAG